ncbi:hypothetical protein G6F68_017589 [Rhizopus microsporus]|nr:hypothetical protein G6F68_017589 [Rhizopus microsporus]
MRSSQKTCPDRAIQRLAEGRPAGPVVADDAVAGLGRRLRHRWQQPVPQHRAVVDLGWRCQWREQRRTQRWCDVVHRHAGRGRGEPARRLPFEHGRDQRAAQLSSRQLRWRQP